ncbi:hypothetical protein [Clostridium novyi]|nr:hypothetical protein [Clostridium novyi]
MLGIDVVEVYKTVKNKMRFSANKNSKIFIVKDNNIFNVSF